MTQQLSSSRRWQSTQQITNMNQNKFMLYRSFATATPMILKHFCISSSISVSFSSTWSLTSVSQFSSGMRTGPTSQTDLPQKNIGLLLLSLCAGCRWPSPLVPPAPFPGSPNLPSSSPNPDSLKQTILNQNLLKLMLPKLICSS